MALVLANAPHKIVPIVAPISNDPSNSGRVKNLRIGGGVNQRQLMRTTSGVQVHPEWAGRGWVLLEDLYEAEGNAEGWAFYQRYLEAWNDNRTRVSFPFERLPLEVQRRQRCGLPDEFADDFAVKPTTGKADDGAPAKRKAAA